MGWEHCFFVLLAFMTTVHGESTENLEPENDAMKNVVLVVIILALLCSNVWVVRRIYRLLKEQNEVKLFSSPAGKEGDEAGKNWKIDYYDLEMGETLGTGATGKTFKAKWRATNVVVKEITFAAREDQIEQEMAHLIRVRHPNLVLFMGLSSPAPDKLCVVMEFMEQGSLFKLIHEGKTSWSWNQRIGMALDITRALSYLHQNKPPLLHTSLHSANILVDKDGNAKLADYALDNIRKSTKKTGLMQQPLWVAPEVIKKGKYTRSSDVYSLGIVLWELLTRKRPYGHLTAHSQVQIMKEITGGTRPLIPSAVPSKFQDLLKACWNQDPAKRPSPAQVAEQLATMQARKVAMSWDTEVKVVEQTDDISSCWNEKDEKRPWMVDYKELKMGDIIGLGSFGEVWTATFRGKKVAVKKLASGTITKSQRKAFIHELNIMCGLRHPNTVLFIGACLEDSHMCLIMEFCEKGNLFDILHDQSQPIDYSLILKTLTEVGEGVMYLHLNDPPILHRDLKSLNIIVDQYWNVKVSDFGLTDFKPDVGEAGSSLQLGTPFWLAPEAMEYQTFSEASDVYSFGMIIWEMFTRQTPFPNMNPHQAALAVISEDTRPEIPKFVPPDFANLIERCWQRDPTKRPTFPRVLEILSELALKGLPRIDLTWSNAMLYQKKTTVYAFRSKDTVIVYKPWGTGEGKKGDYVLVGPNDDVYTCDAAIFDKTYSPLPGRPNLYRKTGKIFSLEMERDFLLETLEGMEHGSKGDWLAQNPVDGEQWPIARKTFHTMYELAPEQTLESEKFTAQTNESVKLIREDEYRLENNDKMRPKKKGVIQVRSFNDHEGKASDVLYDTSAST